MAKAKNCPDQVEYLGIEAKKRTADAVNERSGMMLVVIETNVRVREGGVFVLDRRNLPYLFSR